MDISEPLGTQRWWHSNSYRFWRNGKFVFPMHKHTPILAFVMGPYIYTSSLAEPAAFSRTAECFATCTSLLTTQLQESGGWSFSTLYRYAAPRS